MYLRENKKKILILGATGRLGNYLLNNFNKEIYNLYVNENSIDLSIFENLENLITKVKPDIIINTIALTNVNDCEKNIYKAFKSNTEVVKNLSDIIKNRKKNIFFLQISSDQLYNGTGPHTENSKCHPINVYALTKFFAEVYAGQIQSCIIRTNFFDLFDQKKHFSYINELSNLLSKNKEVTGYGDIYFSPVHISSLFKLINYLCEHPIFGIYNFGSSNGISKYDFSIKISNHLNFNSALIKNVQSSDYQSILRPKDMRLDCTKLKTKIGWVLESIENEVSKIKLR